MSGRLAAVLRHDVRLQYRYGIYAAYAVVVALYCVVLIWAGAWLPDWVPAALIFNDPAALGFFFLGALMMLERGEGVRTALAVSPLGPGEYLAGKVATLTVLSLLATGVIMLVLHRPADPLLLLGSVALTAVQYVGIGVPIALRFRTVNGYLVGAAGFLTPVIGPGLVALLPDMPIWLAVIPAASQLRLMMVATGAASASSGEIVLMMAVAAVAAVAMLLWALAALKREFCR